MLLLAIPKLTHKSVLSNSEPQPPPVPRDGMHFQEVARQPLVGLRSEDEESIGCASLCAGLRSGEWLLADISNSCVKNFSFDHPDKVIFVLSG